jgi:signal transduction histidine kinase
VAACESALHDLDALIPSLSMAGSAIEGSPAHGIDDIPDLVDRMRRTGVSITSVLERSAGDLPAPVQLTAYRIVQECLANAARHAPGARVDVKVRSDQQAVEVQVVDDGPGSTADRSGYGLVGVTERARILGGEVTIGPRADGHGFAVKARLPVASAATLASTGHIHAATEGSS